MNRSAESPEGATEAPRILVVDDEPGIRGVLCRLLDAQGWQPILAESLGEARDALASNDLDLVLTDKNLPDGSGLELLDAARERDPHLSVIVMTAYPDMQSVLEALTHDAYDYLLKPFDHLDDVSRSIKRALERRQLTLTNQKLTEDLQRSNAELVELNAELEAKVAERTKQLHQLSLTDDTTGLYNQRFLFKKIEEECNRAQRYDRPLSVLMLDIDDFKNVNDEHDHIYGSRVLARVGEVIKGAVRAADAVARYGGDEFTVILPETGADDAHTAAERIRSDLEKTDVGEPEQPYQVTVSVGVATHAGEDNAETLLRAADHATYTAKANGKNRVEVAKRS